MIVKAKIRGFICTTAHPAGCAESVRLQAEHAKAHYLETAPKRVLVIGSSGGYGLASRIMACFGGGADTVGIHFDKAPSETRTGTSGFYTTRAFDRLAQKEGRLSYSINGDAFSQEIKNKAAEAIAQLPGGQVDLVIYSLAAPKRTDAAGRTYSSVIKPIGAPFEGKTVDFNTGEVSCARVAPATDSEIEETIAVMGGSDWKDWIALLREKNLLAQGACTVAFSYIGPERTHAIYKSGTIGRAKLDLEQAASELSRTLQEEIGGCAYISVNKALVTQASAAIPVVPLYISLLYKVMKQRGLHEGCIEQAERLFGRLYGSESAGNPHGAPTDSDRRIRLDDLEMKKEVQEDVNELWDRVTSENIGELADIAGYREAFLQIFGFAVPGIDYDADTEIL